MTKHNKCQKICGEWETGNFLVFSNSPSSTQRRSSYAPPSDSYKKLRDFCQILSLSYWIELINMHIDIWRPRTFLRRGRQPKENILRAGKVLSRRFLYSSSLMEKRYLSMWMWLCEAKLKVKTAHFRLPSASQKRACLRRLERVFCCCSACETMEDYKEGYLMVWTNYTSPQCSSIVGLYFKISIPEVNAA